MRPRLLLAGMALVILGGVAHGATVTFINSGPDRFIWAGVPGDFTRYLDITKAPGDQDLSNTLSSFQHAIDLTGASSVRGGFPASQVETASNRVLLFGHALGTQVPSGQPWENAGVVVAAGFGEAFAENEQVFIATRFDVGGGTHFGWIGVTRAGNALDAFAWGYETDVGVPIDAGAGIPSPGAGWLAGVAGLVALRRPRA